MSSLDFRIRYYTNSGEMGVLINGVKYRYFLDAGFNPKIKKLIKHNPGKALAVLKKVAYEYQREDGEKKEIKVNPEPEKEQEGNSKKSPIVQEVTRR